MSGTPAPLGRPEVGLAAGLAMGVLVDGAGGGGDGDGLLQATSASPSTQADAKAAPEPSQRPPRQLPRRALRAIRTSLPWAGDPAQNAGRRTIQSRCRAWT